MIGSMETIPTRATMEEQFFPLVGDQVMPPTNARILKILPFR